MQSTYASDETAWKQAYQDALYELEPKRLHSKVRTAQKAIEARLRSREFSPWELLELEGAPQVLRYFQEQDDQQT
jgi:hypothetical protein